MWADSLKGWLMIFVVLGHAIQNVLGNQCENNHLWNIIYSFHMPAFMAVSGYLAFRPNNRGGQNIVKFLTRRFKQLIIPFLLWSFVLLLIKNNLSLNSAEKIFLYPDNGGFWFLWVLFFISGIFAFGNLLSDYYKIRQELIILIVCFLLVGVMVVFEPRMFGFKFISYYLLFYSVGYFLHKYENKVIARKLLVIIALSLCWLFLAWFWKMHDLPTWLQHFPIPYSIMQYAYRFITATIAIYVLLAVSPIILNKENVINKTLINLGTISLGIYTTHIILISIIVKGIMLLELSNSQAILVSFILALLLSWTLVWLLSKMKVSAKYLLGKV